MLQRKDQPTGLLYPQERAHSGVLDLVGTYAFLKTHRKIIAGWVIIGSIVALVYAFTATPLYTATADVAIDSRKIQLFRNNDQVVGDSTVDSSQVDSEAEILNSQSIALQVVKDLNLTEDPEFVNLHPSPWMEIISTVFGIKADPGPLSEAERERIATDSLRRSLLVRRVGLSYVLELSFRSTDARKAARVANAFADSYISDELNTKYQAARRASVWLQERIAELREQSNAAAHAVEDYKERHNIVDTGDNRGVLSNVQVQELNTQMITATAATAEAKARLDRVEEVLNSATPGEAVGTVSDSLHDDVVTRLRQHYLEDRERAAKWTQMLGARHLAVINLRSEMKELQNSIVDELRRIAQIYKSDYAIAKAREDTLRTTLKKQIRQAGDTGKAQVNLKQLEATSHTYHNIFDSFLQKYTEAVQQQSFPISDARVITAAAVPLHKSYPKTTLLALLGLLVGIAAGLGHSVIRHNFDRAVRRPRDVQQRLGLECLGLVPLSLAKGRQSAQASAQSRPEPKTGSPQPKVFGTKDPSDLFFKTLNDPLSHFSESLRTVKTALDIVALSCSTQCTGIISTVPGEGKSTVAVNLAQLYASSGRSTLLIDADLRKPELSRRLGSGANRGLLEVIGGVDSLATATRNVDQSTLRFLPAVLHQRIVNSGDLLASDRMRTVLSDARRDFHHIIIDLPPLGPLSDALAISPLIDAFVLVVNWGQTRFDMIEEALANFSVASDKLVGIVLNKVNFRELRDRDAYSQGYYYNKQYSKYGYTYAEN